MLTRRDFVLGSGALAVAVSLPLRAEAGSGAAAAQAFVTAFLEVSPDGRVTLHSPTTEMGQGTHTGHAVIIADELGVDLERVTVVTEDALASRERRDCVQAALLQLMRGGPRGNRAAVHFAELSYAEIGETLGVTEKTVKSRLHEARQRLGRMLEPESLQ